MKITQFASIFFLLFTLSACSQVNYKQLNDPGMQAIKPSKTVLKLKTKNEKQLLAYYKTLNAPAFENFKGPFKGTMLDSGNFYHNFVSKIAEFNLYSGHWQGKTFFVINANKGYGFNMFGKKNRRLKLPFNTSIAQSAFDNKNTLRMDYAPYPHLLGKLNAFDEIRQIDNNNFLLLAHFSSGMMAMHPPMIIHLQRMQAQ